MYVLGHLISAHGSGAFPEIDLRDGEHAMTVMVPDLLSCHDWGYSKAWAIAGAGAQSDLVLAHMLGDAVVHYGARWRGLGRKSGWAYLRMGLVARRFEAFYEHAESRGWRFPGLARDSRRGWAHTMVEYSIDQWIADRMDVSALFANVRTAADDTAADLGWVHALIAQHVITPGRPVECQPYRYCGALSRSREPDELHLRGLAVKFQIAETPESIPWLRGWLREIWQAAGDEEMRDVLNSLSDVTADPVGYGYPIEIAAYAERLEPTSHRWAEPADHRAPFADALIEETTHG
jgi:hypothetical protein